MMDDIKLYWLVTASTREYQAIAQGLGSQNRHNTPAGQPQTFHFPGFSLLLVHTGMGSQATSEKLAHLLASTPCSGLISVGYCGALQPGLRTADVVLYSECGPIERNHTVRIWFRPSFMLLSVLDSCLRLGGVQPRVQRAVSCASLVTGADQKKQLGERTGAGVVDMESSTIFQFAHRCGVPRAAIRVVLDEMAQSIDGIQAFLDAKGQFTSDTSRKLMLHAPGLALKLKDLDRRASRTLTAVGAALQKRMLEAQMRPMLSGVAAGIGSKRAGSARAPVQQTRWMESSV
jgi:adenosylhomocysteine nucleosidase